MKTLSLIAFTDKTTGELGLGIDSMPRDESTNAAIDGLAVAHDVVEHVNGAEFIGGIADELEALGALWFVRGCTGSLRRDGVGSFWSAHENVGFDVARMFRDHVHGTDFSFDAPRTKACDAEDDISDILAFASEKALEDVDAELKADAARVLPAYLRQCRARMRLGYRKAQRKYQTTDEANALFWAIANAVDPYAKRAEFDGQRFTLTYGAGRAYCEETYAD